jgi:hypothetical protein
MTKQLMTDKLDAVTDMTVVVCTGRMFPVLMLSTYCEAREQ